LKIVSENVTSQDIIGQMLVMSFQTPFWGDVNPIFGSISQLIISGALSKEVIESVRKSKTFPDDIMEIIMQAYMVYKEEKKIKDDIESFLITKWLLNHNYN